MKHYWVAKNISDEDVEFKIKLWNGSVVADVFHANETVILNSNDVVAQLRLADPYRKFLSIEVRIDQSEGINWKKEGF